MGIVFHCNPFPCPSNRSNPKPIESVGYGIQTAWFTIQQIHLFAYTAQDLGMRLQEEVGIFLEKLYEGMELPSRGFDLRLNGEEDDGL